MSRDTFHAVEIVEWQTVKITDDFTEVLSSNKWATTAPYSGSAAVGDGPDGVLTILPSDASVGNNEDAYVACAKQVFLVTGGAGTGKPLYARAQMLFLEAGINNACNVIFGFMSGVGANALIDNGGGPAVATTLAVIYKIDGGTTWRVQSRNGTEFTDTITTLTASDANYHLFEVLIHDYTPTRCQITYKVDGQFLKDSVFNKPIVHQLLVAASANMSVFAGLKNGEVSTVEQLLVDRIYADTLR